MITAKHIENDETHEAKSIGDAASMALDAISEEIEFGGQASDWLIDGEILISVNHVAEMESLRSQLTSVTRELIASRLKANRTGK